MNHSVDIRILTDMPWIVV